MGNCFFSLSLSLLLLFHSWLFARNHGARDARPVLAAPRHGRRLGERRPRRRPVARPYTRRQTQRAAPASRPRPRSRRRVAPPGAPNGPPLESVDLFGTCCSIKSPASSAGVVGRRGGARAEPLSRLMSAPNTASMESSLARYIGSASGAAGATLTCQYIPTPILLSARPARSFVKRTSR